MWSNHIRQFPFEETCLELNNKDHLFNSLLTHQTQLQIAKDGNAFCLNGSTDHNLIISSQVPFDPCDTLSVPFAPIPLLV